jgi:hypothetical protein
VIDVGKPDEVLARASTAPEARFDIDPVADRLLVHLQLGRDLRDGEEFLGLGHREQGYGSATGLTPETRQQMPGRRRTVVGTLG